jgi:Mitochondrial small ribosomal subunit Rsm22
MIGLRNFGRARTRGIPSIPSSVGKITKIVPDALNPPAKLSPPVKPVLVKPLPTKLSPYIDLTTTGSRTAIPPPRALVDGVMSILKGRDIAGIRTHFADMEASLDARDQSMVRESLRNQAPGHGGAYGSSPPLLYGPKETLAFVLHRMMPLFAVETAVLREVAASLPSFQPKSCLDFGSGEKMSTSVLFT